MSYTTIIIITLLAFLALAFALLYPVYRFLEREEETSKQWTREKLAERRGRKKEDENGHSE